MQSTLTVLVHLLLLLLFLLFVPRLGVALPDLLKRQFLSLVDRLLLDLLCLSYWRIGRPLPYRARLRNEIWSWSILCTRSHLPANILSRIPLSTLGLEFNKRNC